MEIRVSKLLVDGVGEVGEIGVFGGIGIDEGGSVELRGIRMRRAKTKMITDKNIIKGFLRTVWRRGDIKFYRLLSQKAPTKPQ